MQRNFESFNSGIGDEACKCRQASRVGYILPWPGVKLWFEMKANLEPNCSSEVALLLEPTAQSHKSFQVGL